MLCIDNVNAVMTEEIFDPFPNPVRNSINVEETMNER